MRVVSLCLCLSVSLSLSLSLCLSRARTSLCLTHSLTPALPQSIPLGVKCVVSAIYEPPQGCSQDGIELLEDPHMDEVDALAVSLGLQRVGWIFTDLHVR